MRPHKVHVETGPEYPGETCIWCECRSRPETTSLANSYLVDSQDREALFDQGDDLIFTPGKADGKGPERLAAWLKEHAS